MKLCREQYYFVIPMPLDKFGMGPATIGDGATSLTFEVWDRELTSHFSTEFLPNAIDDCNRRNEQYDLERK